MSRPLLTLIAIALTTLSLGPTCEVACAQQEPTLTPKQRRMVQSIAATVRSAGADFQKGDFEAAGKRIRTAMDRTVVAVQEGPEVYDALAASIKRISRAHAMLELEGVSMPPFRTPTRPAARSGAGSGSGAPSVPSGDMANAPGSGQVSFLNQVAPILQKRCGNCHIRSVRGNFSLASYSSLMKGTPAGVVLFAGDVVGSRLIETIETGDMPRGGGSVSPAELDLLKRWIKEGAKFDGQSVDQPIAAAATSSTPTPETAMASGKETVSFARQIAPLLVDACKGCHIDAMRTQGGLSMDTFARLLRGGDNGPIVVPGKADESLLVQKLEGTADGQRMPLGGRPPFSDEAIQLVSTWINEGATLDGDSDRQPLPVMSQLAWAKSATADQISERRRALAETKAKLIQSPGMEVQSFASEHFFAIGALDQETLRQVAAIAEDQLERAQSILKGPATRSPFGGKAGLFVLPRRYDYSEFARMVESRSVPTEWSSHWKFDGVDAYVALVADASVDDDTIERRLLAPVTSLAVKCQMPLAPDWFARGIGDVTANRAAGRKDRDVLTRRQSETATAISAAKNAKEFLNGKLTPLQSDRLGAALISSMQGRVYRRQFDQLLRKLRDGMPFDEAFVVAFGGTPEQFIDGWLPSR
ncbi:MAG: c-type cytochrome domain-containing protein [Planctomycetota bacterium]